VSRLSWPSRQQPEEGFTLVEVLVAMAVMFSALVVLAYTMLSGLTAVGFSRQRTEATALANQALEQIRALPASQLFMSASDLSTDPTNLVSCGLNTCFNSRQVPVATFSAGSSNTPFTPHISAPITAVPGNTQYTVTSYLTLDPGDATGHTLIATVQVTWSNTQRGGVADKVQVESKVYNAQFTQAPPGTHTFMASAQGSPGIITIRGTVLNQQALDATFHLPATSAGMSGSSFPNSTNVGTGAAVTSVTGGIAQSGISAVNGTIQILNTPTATKSAQSPAGSFTTDGPRTDNQTPTVLATLPGVLGITGSLGATVAVGSQASASAVAASAARGGPTTPGSPTPMPNDALGFGQASASQSGAVAANLSVLGALGVNLVNIGLINLVPTGNGPPDLSTVDQNGSSGAPEQQSFKASASQQLSNLDILNLPLLGYPLIKLKTFDQEAYASACATPGPCPASNPVNTGFIQILGGPQISIQTLLNDTAPELALVNSTLKVVNLNLGVATITVGGAGITLGQPATSSPGTASVPSPIGIDLTVNVALPLLGLTVLNVVVHVDLGSVSASASYT
jgi:prepilin-type N-terminal cleavage/methylation domain-containing protein